MVDGVSAEPHLQFGLFENFDDDYAAAMGNRLIIYAAKVMSSPSVMKHRPRACFFLVVWAFEDT